MIWSVLKHLCTASVIVNFVSSTEMATASLKEQKASVYILYRILFRSAIASGSRYAGYSEGPVSNMSGQLEQESDIR